MRTRKVTVLIVSYPEDFNRSLSIKRLLDIREVVEFTDKFLSSKSLEEILDVYLDKVDVYASLNDDLRWYRIVVRDENSRISNIYKA